MQKLAASVTVLILTLVCASLVFPQQLTAPRYDYPATPLLKIVPEEIFTTPGSNFTVDVYLMSETGDLDPFWDVQGIETRMHFNTTLQQALNVTIDPDYDFGKFWPGNLTVIPEEINNVDGYVHVAFAGFPGPSGHTPPSGQIRMFTVAFQTSPEAAPGTSPFSLQNPVSFTELCWFAGIRGLIDLAAPTDTFWQKLLHGPAPGPFQLTTWTDNGDTSLGPSDLITLNDTSTGAYYDCQVNELMGLLDVAYTGTSTTEDLWIASFGPDALVNFALPGRSVGTDDPYNGYGVPYWTGNISLPNLLELSSITVHALPLTADEYTHPLVEGIDYIVHAAEDKVELLIPLDIQILNEHWVDGVNNTLNGWPAINYVASGIDSVYVKFPNGTERYARNNGYAQSPPSEWWYDPDWTWELEGWWALGYHDFSGPWTWPAGSEWWINYTAASYLTVDYFADEYDPSSHLKYVGSYSAFLSDLHAPIGTDWDEAVMGSGDHHQIGNWSDNDASGALSAEDTLLTVRSGDPTHYQRFRVNNATAGLVLNRKPWICEHDPTCPFFGYPRTVEVVGFPHPERDICPWHNNEYALRLPHLVENAELRVWDIESTGWHPTCPFPYVPSPEPRPGESVTVDACILCPCLDGVELSFGVNGGSWWNTSMTYNATNALWTAIIPGTPGNATVDFFITARDEFGNQATTELASYAVKPLLIGDLDGDGDVDIFDVVRIAGNYGKTLP